MVIHSVLWRVADIEKISSPEYAIDGNLSRFTGCPVTPLLQVCDGTSDKLICVYVPSPGKEL
jgi:hypothetical protein